MVPTYIHTLRFKLTFLHTAVFALLITGTCVLFLNIQRRGLLEDIDDRLHARAETVLEDFVALRDEGLSISAPGRVRPWIDPKRFPSFFVQFRNKSGSVIHRSQTLQTGGVTSAPASRSHWTPWSQRAWISAGIPSTTYSRGTPIRRPLTPRPRLWVQSGVATSRLVESLGSNEHIERSRMAASSTVRVIGPA